jgi:hypothetical protein
MLQLWSLDQTSPIYVKYVEICTFYKLYTTKRSNQNKIETIYNNGKPKYFENIAWIINNTQPETTRKPPITYFRDAKEIG